MRRSLAPALALAITVSACAHHAAAPPARPPVAPPTAAELPPPDAIPGTFAVRQKLTASSAKGGGSFEAVLQKAPGTLTLVGLTPYGSRAFLLQQTKGGVLGTWLGPPLPSGERSGQHGDEAIHERWQDGKLIERTFSSTKSNPPGTITISYDGYGASGIATHITLRNARLDYRIDIDTVPFQ